MMKQIFKPNLTVNSIADIDLEYLKQAGVRGILMDFDNTLVRWNGSSISRSVKSWVKAAQRAGFSLCIVSNAVTARLKGTAAKLGVPFVAQALKPTPIGINKALRSLDVAPDEAVMIGDQLFTDVLAGRCGGLHTVLIRPKVLYEQWWMKGVRHLEDLICGLGKFNSNAA